MVRLRLLTYGVELDSSLPLSEVVQRIEAGIHMSHAEAVDHNVLLEACGCLLQSFVLPPAARAVDLLGRLERGVPS